MIFLDIIDSNGVSTTVTNASETLNTSTSSVSENISLFQLLIQGGVIMIPLALIFIIAVWVFFERYFTIKKALNMDDRFIHTIRDYVINGNLIQARSYTKALNGPVYKVIEKGLMRIGKPIDIIENSMENTGKVEMYKLEKNLSIMSSIAGIAPMFGFLGTIAGMIKLFYGISSTGEYTLGTIAGGIYTKMVTSATGLIIGLLAYLAYNYLNMKVDKVSFKIQEASTEFLDILQEPIKQ